MASIKKVALITGATSGLGEALAILMMSNDVEVYGVGRNQLYMEELKQLYPDKFHPLVFDISKPDSWAGIIEVLPDIRFDYVVHCASSVAPIGRLCKLDYSDWRKALAVNLEAPVFLTKALTALLGDNSRVLFISSGSTYVPIGGVGPYCVSKAALEMARKVLTMETKPFLLASFMPSMMDTDLQAELRAANKSDLPTVSYFAEQHTENNLVSPELCAEFVYWLLSQTSNDSYKDQEWDIENTEHSMLWKNAGLELGLH